MVTYSILSDDHSIVMSHVYILMSFVDFICLKWITIWKIGITQKVEISLIIMLWLWNIWSRLHTLTAHFVCVPVTCFEVLVLPDTFFHFAQIKINVFFLLFYGVTKKSKQSNCAKKCGQKINTPTNASKKWYFIVHRTF